MKNIYTTFVLALTLCVSLNAQTVFTSNFETSSANTSEDLIDWYGLKTSLESDSINIITSGSMFGLNAVQLVNTENSHKRFTSNSITLDSTESYLVEMWVKGEGEIRTNYYSNEYGQYNDYVVFSETDWTKIEQTISPEQFSDTAELIISVRNTVGMDHMMIDSVALTVVGGTPTSIKEQLLKNINFYPNPANHTLTLNLEANSTVLVYDLMGKVVLQEVVAKGTQNIDISSISNGLYTLSVKSENGTTLNNKFKVVK